MFVQFGSFFCFISLILLSIFDFYVSLIILAIYGFVFLPPGIKTYSKIDFYASEESSIPLIVFCLMRFCTTITLMVPYAMLSELFSLKSRSMATAIATGMNNILAFVAIKSFYNLENWFDLPTTMGVYCSIGVIGYLKKRNYFEKQTQITKLFFFYFFENIV